MSAVGGGAMPTAQLPTAVVTVNPCNKSIGELQAALRDGDPAVIGRIQGDRLVLDPRTISDTEFQLLAVTLARALK